MLKTKYIQNIVDRMVNKRVPEIIVTIKIMTKLL
jgi:hypothetical protein